MNTAVPERQPKSERTFSVDRIPGQVALLFPNGRVEFLNRSQVDYFGQSLEELSFGGSNGTVHHDDLVDVA